MTCLSALPLNRPNSLHLSHILVLKRHKVTKEKLQFSQPSVTLLGHLLTPESLNLDPSQMWGILASPNPKLKDNFKRSWDLQATAIIGSLLFPHSPSPHMSSRKPLPQTPTMEQGRTCYYLKEQLTQAPS